MRASIKGSLALGVAFVTAAACGYYDDSLLLTKPVASGGSAGSSGGSPEGGSASSLGGAGGVQGNGGHSGVAGSGGIGGSGGSGALGGSSGSAGNAGVSGAGHAGTSGASGSAGKSGGGAAGVAGTSGTAGNSGSAGTGGTPCTHAAPVGRPTITNAGGTTEVVVAIRTADFEEGADFKALGYDLDKTCTCEGESDSCLPSPTAAAGSTCDGPDGRDNSAGALISEASLLGLSSASLNKNITNGGATIMLRIRNYDGMADDDQVQVAWFITSSFKDGKDGGATMPAWDGNDVWPIRDTSVKNEDPNMPLFVDETAYVAGGTLVASLKGDAPLELNPNFIVTLRATFLTATIGPGKTPGSFALTNGIIAGRWPAQNLLSQLGYYAIFGSQLCTDNPAYPTIKQKVCDSADILSDLGTPTDTCDAISTALAFTADPAMIGDVIPQSAPVAECPPATDPANDSCDSGSSAGGSGTAGNAGSSGTAGTAGKAGAAGNLACFVEVTAR